MTMCTCSLVKECPWVVHFTNRECAEIRGINESEPLYIIYEVHLHDKVYALYTPL